ncbi:MAG: tetratricopeptide repeat protein, partial [Gammaproteobacteria bacterium]
ERLTDERDRLVELDDGERSVASAFLLSFQELPAEERRLFELLALHPGPETDTGAAAALADADRRQANYLLERLLDAHLIVQQVVGRYRFHDLVRAFASDQALADLPGAAREAAMDRLLDYYLHTADLADRLITPHRLRIPLDIGRPPTVTPRLTDFQDALQWITTELPNLVAACRAAAAHGRDVKCWQLAFTLRGPCFLTKAWDAWLETHELALGAARRIGDRKAEAITLNNLGLVLIERGELDVASTSYQHALALFQELGDRHGATNSLANYAWVHHYRGDHRRAVRDLQSAYQSYARAGSRRNAAISLRGIGIFKAALGEFADAVHDIEAALQACNELGLDLDATMALNCLGSTRHRMGQRER